MPPVEADAFPPGPRPRRTGHQRPQATRRVCRTVHRAVSSPTPPGSPAPPLHTTCTGGSNTTPNPTAKRTLTNGNTVRTQLFRLPGRIVNHGRKNDPAAAHQMALGPPTYLTTLTRIREPPPTLLTPGSHTLPPKPEKRPPPQDQHVPTHPNPVYKSPQPNEHPPTPTHTAPHHPPPLPEQPKTPAITHPRRPKR